MEVIRTLENQVRDLSSKLETLERKAAVVPGKEAPMGAAKNAEV